MGTSAKVTNKAIRKHSHKLFSLQLKVIEGLAEILWAHTYNTQDFAKRIQLLRLNGWNKCSLFMHNYKNQELYKMFQMMEEVIASFKISLFNFKINQQNKKCLIIPWIH